MFKFNKNGEEYWVGHNPKIGYLIFDPLVQSNEDYDHVRLYVVDRGKSSSFRKSVRDKLTPDNRLDKAFCERILKPYAEQRKKLKARVASCFRCGNNLNSFDYGICDKCGWIQCSCGACGCEYNTVIE